MRGERIAAIVIGIIMLMSIAGFASIGFLGSSPANEPQGQQLQPIMERQLTSQELVYALQTGRIVIKHHYPLGCTECAEKDGTLRSFTIQYPGFVLLETLSVNSTSTTFQIIGNDGRVTDLNYTIIDEGTLLETFCQAAVIKPRECLLLQV